MLFGLLFHFLDVWF